MSLLFICEGSSPVYCSKTPRLFGIVSAFERENIEDDFKTGDSRNRNISDKH